MTCWLAGLVCNFSDGHVEYGDQFFTASWNFTLGTATCVLTAALCAGAGLLIQWKNNRDALA